MSAAESTLKIEVASADLGIRDIVSQVFLKLGFEEIFDMSIGVGIC